MMFPVMASPSSGSWVSIKKIALLAQDSHVGCFLNFPTSTDTYNNSNLKSFHWIFLRATLVFEEKHISMLGIKSNQEPLTNYREFFFIYSVNTHRGPTTWGTMLGSRCIAMSKSCKHGLSSCNNCKGTKRNNWQSIMLVSAIQILYKSTKKEWG